MQGTECEAGGVECKVRSAGRGPPTVGTLPRSHLGRQLDAALLLRHLRQEQVGDAHQDARAVACAGWGALRGGVIYEWLSRAHQVQVGGQEKGSICI